VANTFALVISIVSLVLAATSLGWNIYRDVLLKARVRIRFGIRTIITHGSEDRPDYLIVSATNHGPGAVNVSMVQLRRTSLWRRLSRRTEHAVMIHDFTNPLSGQLPKTLGVGETIDLLFPYERQCLLGENWSHVGISDTFGRVHWAPTRHVREARKTYRGKFAAA
jgi:hypothetical protein